MSQSTRNKTGANVKHYESPELIKKFDKVRKSLSSLDPSISNKSLAQLTAEIITFMEQRLGKHVRLAPHLGVVYVQAWTKV